MQAVIQGLDQFALAVIARSQPSSASGPDPVNCGPQVLNRGDHGDRDPWRWKDPWPRLRVMEGDQRTR